MHGPETGGRPRVVVGVDGSPGSTAALAHAMREAAGRGADLEVVAAYPVPLPLAGGVRALVPDPEALARDTAARARASVEEVRRAVGPLGDDEETVDLVVSEGPAGPVLVERSRDAELLVVGSRGRGAVRSALLGSVALHCATGATCPVVLVPPHPAPLAPEPRVVAGVDGSAGARAALAVALREARRAGASLEVLAAYEPAELSTETYGYVPATMRELRAEVERGTWRLVEEVVQELAEDDGTDVGPPVEVVVVEGTAAEALVRSAARAAHLVVGTRGHGGIRGLLLGSVALRCLVAAPCPVMVVPLPSRPAGAPVARPAEPAAGVSAP
ncbi:universal stress protein [Trujillonella humicola]|uniref:universal stress protein n=1 Tax=Trujillonella humicola TaxID=3383699 RepID=UPI003906A50C